MEQDSILPFDAPGALDFSESDSESSCILEDLEEDSSLDAFDFKTADSDFTSNDDV